MTFAFSHRRLRDACSHIPPPHKTSPPPLPAHISTANRPTSKNPTATISARRNDELTLAGLRPGQDDFAKAQKLFRKPTLTKFDGTNPIWHDTCRNQSLSIITDADSGTIQEVRVSENNSKFASATPSSTIARIRLRGGGTVPPHERQARSRWLTGHGLLVGSSCSRVFELYGQPGSRGPSTKDGQQLELLYYAFDWAGPDVPQVMAVLCTPGKQRQTRSSGGNYADGAKSLMNSPTQKDSRNDAIANEPSCCSQRALSAPDDGERRLLTNTVRAAVLYLGCLIHPSSSARIRINAAAYGGLP